ncbi:MAG: 4Fe-4S dicluster domain-containing protein [Gracilibacteraceae bacterium]|jgi:Fe-S-cluster-containing dehydrogenase component|nr:4Fe-4S dicluster domain-containing protein [Gracilibacteraceae bacterium]
MNRRKFLSLASAGIAAAASSVNVRAASADVAEGRPEAVGVLHDSTLCIGCRSCEAACQSVNSSILPRPENYRTPEKPFYDRSVLAVKRQTDFQRFTVVNRYAVEGRYPVHRKFQCNHCMEPACASACFVKALYKTPEGPVLYRSELCVGCRYCMVACPFFVPAYDYDNAWNPLVYKCTMCAPRIASGQVPGCVSRCPEKALIFGKRSELIKIAQARIMESPEKYVKHVYGEHEAGGTCWLYLSPVPHKLLDQPEVGDVPPSRLTSGVLEAAGVAAGILSVLLGAACAVSRRRVNNADDSRAEGAESDPARGSGGDTHNEASEGNKEGGQ